MQEYFLATTVGSSGSCVSSDMTRSSPAWGRSRCPSALINPVTTSTSVVSAPEELMTLFRVAIMSYIVLWCKRDLTDCACGKHRQRSLFRQRADRGSIPSQDQTDLTGCTTHEGNTSWEYWRVGKISDLLCWPSCLACPCSLKPVPLRQRAKAPIAG